MKSCCNSCKQGKPCCGSDMAPSSLSGSFRRRGLMGYGVYGYGDAVPAAPTAPATVVAAPAPKKILGLDPKIAYLLGAVVIWKVLF